MIGADREQVLSSSVDPAALPAELRAVRDYWNAKRGALPMPPRAAIDPMELRAHLPFLLLVDVLPEADDFRFRLAGTGITRQMGRDSTGKTVREAYAADPDMMAGILDVFSRVVKLKRPVFKRGTLRVVQKDFVVSESVYLPLSDDGEQVSMLLGRALFTRTG